jgi:hypothetical protein
MDNGETAKLFRQARVRRLGRGVLLEPMERSVEDIRAIFAEIDRLGGTSFLPEGRPKQPPMPSQSVARAGGKKSLIKSRSL